MFSGRFDHNRRPRLRLMVSLYGISIVGYVDFLVDTGADATLLAPDDATKLGVDYSVLDESTVVPAYGLGQRMQYIEKAELRVPPDGPIIRSVVEIGILQPEAKPENANDSPVRLPSLLGRDALYQVKMVYDAPNNQISFWPVDLWSD